jgi:uncharacterized protein YjbI with pentapeptide repeats
VHWLAAGVSFFSALAEGANFKGANMTLADLESGNFEDADFTDVVLEGAFVNNAQFKVGQGQPLNLVWSTWPMSATCRPNLTAVFS